MYKNVGGWGLGQWLAVKGLLVLGECVGGQ